MPLASIAYCGGDGDDIPRRAKGARTRFCAINWRNGSAYGAMEDSKYIYGYMAVDATLDLSDADT